LPTICQLYDRPDGTTLRTFRRVTVEHLTI